MKTQGKSEFGDLLRATVMTSLLCTVLTACITPDSNVARVQTIEQLKFLVAKIEHSYVESNRVMGHMDRVRRADQRVDILARNYAIVLNAHGRLAGSAALQVREIDGSYRSTSTLLRALITARDLLLSDYRSIASRLRELCQPDALLQSEFDHFLSD
ncbi:MAG: hypothetical protein E2O84_02945 [Bacteroidetes bacterium]|nr:MAG: hypothetical protein E2O84_02945 [Bacteroidota bacterium]